MRTTDADANHSEKGVHSNFCLNNPSIVTRALVRLKPYAESLLLKMPGVRIEVGTRIFA